MFGSLKIAMVAILITGIAGAGMYVMKLRSDNAILKANQVKLESAVADQKQLIENQKKDFEEILSANKKMNELVSVLKKDLEDLDLNIYVEPVSIDAGTAMGAALILYHELTQNV